jgi:CIC family chloride channel protein
MKATTAEGSHGGLITLGLLSLVAGAVSGLVGGVFRRSLDQADRFRTLFIARFHVLDLRGALRPDYGLLREVDADELRRAENRR